MLSQECPMDGNKCPKKGCVEVKGIPVLCLAFYFAVYILFPQYLGEVADFCLDDIGEIDFWGRK